MKRFLIAVIAAFLFLAPSAYCQINLTNDLPDINYSTPVEYEIGGITISGVQFLDNTVLITLSGLAVGDKIKVPGEEINKAIQKLWEQGLFGDIKITATKVQGNLIFLDIYLKEKPRLSKFSFTGVTKSEADKLRDEIKITRGDAVTENVISNIKNKTKNFFIDKGYLFASVDVLQKADSSKANNVDLSIDVKKNGKIKINKINIYGNAGLESIKIKRAMKKTKEKHIYRLFATSRYNDEDFAADKILAVGKFNELGYRDAKIVKDSVYKFDNKTVNVDLYFSQGPVYYFRNINWIGNTKYTAADLNSILRVSKGDIYNQKALEANLNMNADGKDITSLYMDDGYLFFQVTPVEVKVENDSIDLEIRIYEGKQAVISKILISGNTKTNDNVIIREIRTKPGMLFSRQDIIRTQRELIQLGYFNQEKLSVNPIPHAADGTVDIEYTVEESSSDQVELSGGWGAGSIVGTLGISFNNFAAKNFFKKDAWRPLPSGAGQKLSLRAQSNGVAYQSYNASFTEPWLGGKKPNALSVSIYRSIQTNGVAKGNASRQAIIIDGVAVDLSKRLTWPDDFFLLSTGLSYQRYSLTNYTSFALQNGKSNNINGTFELSRNSIDAVIYPRSGSQISLTLQATPPYSLFSNKNYKGDSDQEKYKWLEYHKWKFASSLFTKLTGDLVLNTRMKFGFLGYYNSDLGAPPFERFYLGGDGLSGYSLDGRDIIGMRGYANQTLTPSNSSGYIGGIVYDKFTLELRYPVSLNPMATVYLLTFLEGGNCWDKFSQFNPFNVYKSAGIGVRIYLPMFGLLGLDWGFGFDAVKGNASANKSQFHFSINQSSD